MESDYKKITQILNYLIRKDERTSKVPELKIIKLVWAADRYHLRKYARLVSGDRYVAMKNGPVGSLTKDVAEFSDNSFSGINSDDFPYIKSYINFEKYNELGFLSSVNDVDYDELSDSDREALDFAWKQFGKYDYRTLINITHKYPEWTKHKKDIESRIIRQAEIDLVDFFENIDDPNDPFSSTDDFVNSSKEIFLELR